MIRQTLDGVSVRVVEAIGLTTDRVFTQIYPNVSPAPCVEFCVSVSPYIPLMVCGAVCLAQ